MREIKSAPFGFITTGNDKCVRVWTLSGEMIGDINLVKEKTRMDQWNFRYDWAEKKKKQLK